MVHLDIIIAANSKTPLFEQIKEQIKDAIYADQIREGDMLPSMRQLAKDLNVSVITTKRAYEDLEREGFVVTSVGKGTFVGSIEPHILREWQLREVENTIEQLVRDVRRIGLSRSEFLQLIDVYLEEA